MTVPAVAPAAGAIDLRPLQARRLGVLQVLNGPDPSAVVAFDENRLPDVWFAGEQFDAHAIERSDVLFSYRRGKALPPGSACQGEGDGKNQDFESTVHGSVFRFPIVASMNS